ncbi:hypothetical protein [Paenibacillus sp. L3-i20]|uniref:hypothetical protein n=1 Tax=Paenibacillus sp. L3-i20 TaxID=2905833 RepID=UPI001EE09753|nr:hypothetical protein [Paenibacillus sp. L3-i20]GKU76719.1 hypothetical protein L3i20_v211160 [Paenibacillus sp. L3-i20]
MSNNKINETTDIKTNYESEKEYKDVHMEAFQNAEGGGPLKRINLNDMPIALRIFQYFIRTVVIIFVIAAIVVSVMK